jgi:hypothetical protein
MATPGRTMDETKAYPICRPRRIPCRKVGAGRSGGFAEHCSAPAKPAGCAKPAVEARRGGCRCGARLQPLGWNAIERAETVKASEKHMPSSAPWVFSEGKIASTIFTEPQA